MRDTEHMRAMLEGYRREIAATPDDRRRLWARLAKDEGAGVSDATPAPAPRGMIVAIAIAIAVAAAVVLVLGLAERIAQRTVEATPQHQTPDVVERSRELGAIHGAPAPAMPPVHGAAAPVVTPDAPATQRATTSDARGGRDLEDPLHGELVLVDAARAAIDRGDPDAALARLAEHRARFPDAALAPEARALRAIALCSVGRTAQGRGEARLLLRERDMVAHHARVREACGVQ